MPKNTMQFYEDFKVVTKSENHNSFGLYQMVVMNNKGEAFQTHAGSLYAKSKGETIKCCSVADIVTEKIIRRTFIGHEMTTRIEDAPAKVLNEVW